ncbi:MAG: maleylpyruvate isomerase N-terminal domain-containing protein [Chloroflexota bacterium]
MSAERLVALRRELADTREDLSAALADADPALLTAPGLVGEWSARELVAHLAHWNDWASTCLAAAVEGRLVDLVTDEWDVDAQNAEVAREAASMPMSAVRDREAESHERFASLLAGLDPSVLAMPTPWGGTIEATVIENGPGHYAEHARHVREWFAGADADDADDSDD